ncbi:MAG: hypothetical protein ABJ092_00740 [Gillisia sp.]
MKIIKNLVLSSIFLIGLTAMSNDEDKSQNETLQNEGPSCSTMFTICDAAAPDSFDDFYACMARNGCG